MPLRSKIVSALRYLHKNPNVPENGIRHIAGKLQEEGNPEDIQKYLRIAHRNLIKGHHVSPTSPMMRNITRLSRQVGK